MVNYPVPEELDDPRLRRFFDYWRSQFRDGDLPLRKDFDPLDVPELLGLINIMEVVRTEAGGFRFRYRLWGSQVTHLFGADHTGKYIDEIVVPTRIEEVHAALASVVLERKPHFWQVRVPLENRDYQSNRRLALPYCDADGVVSNIMTLMIGDRRT